MTGNNQKKPLEWIKIAQFVMFAVSCIAGVMIWFYAQQDRVSDKMAQNYETGIERIKNFIQLSAGKNGNR